MSLNEEQTHRAQPELSIVEKKIMKFYEIPETKCRMHFLVYSMGTNPARLKAAVHYTLYTPYLAEI